MNLCNVPGVPEVNKVTGMLPLKSYKNCNGCYALWFDTKVSCIKCWFKYDIDGNNGFYWPLEACPKPTSKRQFLKEVGERFEVFTVAQTEILSVELIAKELHEAGREAVVHGNTVAATNFNIPSRTFLEWNEISEEARDGRRMQARALLKKFQFIVKGDYVVPD